MIKQSRTLQILESNLEYLEQTANSSAQGTVHEPQISFKDFQEAVSIARRILDEIQPYESIYINPDWEEHPMGSFTREFELRCLKKNQDKLVARIK